MISSSDRRVLDDLDPEATQSARDRQAIRNRPKGDLQGPQTSSLLTFSQSGLPNTRPVTSIKSMHGEMQRHLAEPWPARLALQLEAHLGKSTILSDVSRKIELPIRRDAALEAARLFNPGAGSTGSRETY